MIAFSIFLILMELLFVASQESTTAVDNATHRVTDFIDFDYGEESQIFFSYGDYLIKIEQRNLTFEDAMTQCKVKSDGILLWLITILEAERLADALSQVDIAFDCLWVGGKLENSTWIWYHPSLSGLRQIAEEAFPIEDEILDYKVEYNYSFTADQGDKEFCLAFGRREHVRFFFQKLDCNAERPSFCFVGYTNDDVYPSSHNDWIKIDERWYKIFSPKYNHSGAQNQCLGHFDSNLAVISNHVELYELGRHLRINRPSLEIAHIGARCNESLCQFEPENITIGNETSDDGYPRWLHGEVKRGIKENCVALDRHQKVAQFVQVDCDRELPYICYITFEYPFYPRNIKDFIFNETGYRIYFLQLPWEDANKECRVQEDKYKGKLVEVREKVVNDHLLFILSDNRSVVNHIWLGGVYNEWSRQWEWVSDNSPIPDAYPMSWIRNESYTEEVDDFNTCLNMDKENPYKVLHYGTLCLFKQAFICQYPTEGLLRLQRDEYLGLVKSKNVFHG